MDLDNPDLDRLWLNDSIVIDKIDKDYVIDLRVFVRVDCSEVGSCWYTVDHNNGPEWA